MSADVQLILFRDPAIHAESLKASTAARYTDDPDMVAQVMSDEALEAQINRECELICTTDYESARAHSHHMAALIAQRSKQRVAEMERKRGLR